SLMCAYNRVFGSPACGSALLLDTILRGEWRFPGYVVSDCGAIDDMYERHRVVPTAAAAAALGVRMGTDLDCGREYGSLLDAVHQGLITEQAIDSAVTRLSMACSVMSPWCTARSEEHTSELQSRVELVCRLLLEKRK